MNSKSPAYLVIQKGEPYNQGEKLQLNHNSILLGRKDGEHQPDVSFNSRYVSRSHALIERVDDAYLFTDLETSRHGCRINGARIDKSTPVPINQGDIVSLGLDEVIFVFYLEPGLTLSYLPIMVDSDSRKVYVDLDEVVITGRAYELLELLFQCRGKVISREEIFNKVWPDRKPDIRGELDISPDEYHQLISRLRKALGDRGKLVKTVPSYGLKLELPPE